MKEMTLLTPAKINLSIDVTGRLENGYHTVEMIMQSISLYDEVAVEKTNGSISVRCAQPFVPNDSRNIAWKAAEAFFAECPQKGGASIILKKNIPVAAGLAGGSANAAGVLKALNRLYGSPLNEIKAIEILKKLGADVPFCLRGGTQLARGIGDELTILPNFSGVQVVLVKPPFPVSTPRVYRNLDLAALGERPDTSALINGIEEFDVGFVARNMRNVLESVTVREYPEIRKIMERFMEYGALGTRMSGSGPTVFGIFEGKAQAAAARDRFSADYEHVFHVETLSREEDENG